MCNWNTKRRRNILRNNTAEYYTCSKKQRDHQAEFNKNKKTLDVLYLNCRKQKETFEDSPRRIKHLTYRETRIKTVANFSSETTQLRMQFNSILKVLKE